MPQVRRSTWLAHTGRLTDLHAVEAKVKTGKNHLAQTIAWAERGVKRHGDDGQEVDEQTREERIDKAQMEHGHRQRTNGKGGDHHIC